jgi:hypothetical protein
VRSCLRSEKRHYYRPAVYAGNGPCPVSVDKK